MRQGFGLGIDGQLFKRRPLPAPQSMIQPAPSAILSLLSSVGTVNDLGIYATYSGAGCLLVPVLFPVSHLLQHFVQLSLPQPAALLRDAPH